MADATFFLRPLTAAQALEKVSAVAGTIFGGRAFSLHLTTNVSAITINATDIQQGLIDQRPEIVAFQSRLAASNTALACSSFTLTESQNNQKPRLIYVTSEPAVAQISIENFNDPDRIIAGCNALSNTFELISNSTLILQSLPVPQKEAIRYQSAVTAELHAAVSRIGTFGVEQLKRQDEFFNTLALQQGERHQKREEQLDARHHIAEEELRARQQSLDAEHRSRITSLEEREREHQRQVAEHDTRESTAVRRELLVKLEQLLDKGKEIQISDTTVDKRRLVHLLCALAMLASATLVAYFAVKVAAEPDPRWHHITPLSAGVLLFASTLIYYVKWIDHWFREHARAEFQNRKLRSDIVRASWLAELIFEGRDKNKELPDLLVARFSDGLFLEASDRGVEHPTESAVGFLQKISSIKLGQGTLEVTKTASKEG